MKVAFDFSVLSGPSEAYGFVKGEVEVVAAPIPGARLDLMPRHAELVTPLHVLEVRSVLPPVAPGSAALVMLEDVITATVVEARDLFAVLAQDYGYDAWPFGEDEPYPSSTNNVGVEMSGWHAGDVVCVAAIPLGQPVDWSPGSYDPKDAVWVPEGAFERVLREATQLGLPILSDLRLHQQTRVSRADCMALMTRWDELLASVDGTPGAIWASAIARLLQLCVEGEGQMELLIEGP